MCKVVSNSSSNLVSDERVKLPSNSCRSVSSSSSSPAYTKLSTAQVSNLVQVREYDPNTPLVQGPVNYVAVSDSSPCNAGTPTLQTGDVGTSASATGECVAACNSCLSQDIDIVRDTIDIYKPHICNTLSEDSEEEVRAGGLSLAVSESHSRHTDRQSSPQCCLRADDGSHNRPIISQSNAQTDKGSVVPELDLRDNFKPGGQASAASRAQVAGASKEESGRLSTGGGKLHGAVGPLNAEAAEAQRPWERVTTASEAWGPLDGSRTSSGDPYLCGPRGDRLGIGGNGIGLPELGPGSAQPVIHRSPVASVHGPIGLADARVSQQHQRRSGEGPIEHEPVEIRPSTPSIRQKVRASGARSGTCTGDALLDPNSSLFPI